MGDVRIFDSCMYNGEAMLLKARLDVLKDTVHKHIIVEATHTHQGHPKELRFDKEQFKEYEDRIRYVVVDDLPNVASPPSAPEVHANEQFQRNCIMRGLTDARDEDWVIVADLDEIVRPEAIRRFKPKWPAGIFRLAFHHYYFNVATFKSFGRRVFWRGARITTHARLRDLWVKPHNLRGSNLKHLSGVELSRNKLRKWHEIRNAGWHFAYLMTPEQIRQKLGEYCHTHYATDEYRDLDTIANHMDKLTLVTPDLGKKAYLKKVPIDPSWPKGLLDTINSHPEFVLKD